MSFIESMSIALFCFAMVFIVLTMLYFLIKTFSYFIDWGNRTYSNRHLKKDDKKRNNLNNTKNNNNPVITSVTDEQGNVRNYKMHITAAKGGKDDN